MNIGGISGGRVVLEIVRKWMNLFLKLISVYVFSSQLSEVLDLVLRSGLTFHLKTQCPT